MKICLIGQNLTNLILANVFAQKKLNVDVYLNRKIQKIKTNRTIAISNENFEFLKSIAKSDIISWKIKVIKKIKNVFSHYLHRVWRICTQYHKIKNNSEQVSDIRYDFQSYYGEHRLTKTDRFED